MRTKGQGHKQRKYYFLNQAIILIYHIIEKLYAKPIYRSTEINPTDYIPNHTSNLEFADNRCEFENHDKAY